MRIAGCRRTVATCTSRGSRYLLTATGPALGAVGLMCSEGVDEFRQRVARAMQPGKNAMNEMSGTGGLSGQVVHDEGDGRPCCDLLHHPDHLPARAQPAPMA